MSQKEKIYVVEYVKGTPPPDRLIRGASLAEVKKFIEGSMVSVRVATPDDLVKMTKSGVDVETAPKSK